ncbi:MAG: glycosyltransferase family A protein [Plesiomonas shigelloides]
MKLTIFTPIYNREILIRRVYESLINQKFKDFEWLIINDGSTDNSEQIIKSFIEENKINIRYYFKKNGGKHTAYNLAIEKAKGDLFLILDSDDIVLENGIYKILNIWEKYRDKKKLLGISGVDLDKNLNIIGDFYPKDGLVCSHLEMREKFRIKGDKTEIFQTKYLKGLYFEKYKNEKFLTEAILFDKLYSKYKTIFFNIPLIIRDYQKDGLSDNSLRLRTQNPLGAMYYYLQNSKLCITKLKMYRSKINYFRFYYHSKNKYKEDIEIKNRHSFFKIIGKIYYYKDLIKLK